eukprot:13337791-Alexandrium_andersonii.AAC.1
MAQPRALCPAALSSGSEVKTSQPRERHNPRTEGVCTADRRVSWTANTCTSCVCMSAKTSTTRVLRVPTLHVAMRRVAGC